jgi:hypothetical protein
VCRVERREGRRKGERNLGREGEREKAKEEKIWMCRCNHFEFHFPSQINSDDLEIY